MLTIEEGDHVALTGAPPELRNYGRFIAFSGIVRKPNREVEHAEHDNRDDKRNECDKNDLAHLH
jgi:hypothetical protein